MTIFGNSLPLILMDRRLLFILLLIGSLLYAQNNSDKKLGLIAQDLQRIIPEVVKTHVWEKDEATGVVTRKDLDRLGVYYSDLVPVLINAIKEQQQHIQQQQQTIERLETQMDAYSQLEARLLQLEQRLQP